MDGPLMSAREELAAIRERVEAATDGPWENDGGGEIGQHYTCLPPYRTIVGTEVSCSSYCYGGSTKGVERDADAEFIAHARTDVPRLVEALDAVVKALDEAGTQAAATYRSDGAHYNEGQLDAVELVETRVLAAIETALTTDTKGEPR